MNTSAITPETLASSVIAVPPLAQGADLSLARSANESLIRHLEAGGITTLLYGGNAILYHLAVSEYAELLEMLTELAGPSTLVVPSAGPAFGTMMDQAAILREFDFPSAMILPQKDVTTFAGIAAGVRRFVDVSQRPAVLYLKQDGYLDIATVQRLMADGLLSWIKYAVVRDDPAEDDFLRALIDAVGPDRVVSGIGEQPAVTHLRDFGLAGFTSGCVCLAPRRSLQMLRELQAGNVAAAEAIRATFRPLEDLRNSIHPIRVLHAAVTLAGIADMGPILPLLSEIDPADEPAVEQAARDLLSLESANV